VARGPMGSPWGLRANLMALALVTSAVAIEDIWSVAGYQKLRKRCKWYDSTITARLRGIPAWNGPQWQTFVPNAQVRTCVVDLSGPGDTVLHIVRLGNADGSPTRMAPGAWRMWRLSVSYPQSVVQENSVFVRLAAWRFSPVYANGSDVGLPPLHNHHSVAFNAIPTVSNSTAKALLQTPQLSANKAIPPWMLWQNTNEWGNAGDSQCDPDRGGPECIMRKMPPGTAMIARSAPTYDAVLNDVRPIGSSREEYPIFHEMATLLYKPTPKPQFTGLRDSHYLQWFQHATPHMGFDTFTVPSEGPSVMGRTHAWPFAGQIVKYGWHGHHSLTDEGYVFSGALSDLLDELGGGVPLGNETNEPQLIRGDVEAFKKTLLEKAARAGARLLCRYLPHRESLPPVAGMAPQLYDRAAMPAGDQGCDVDDYHFKAGEPFTVLCINKPGVQGSLNEQHCNWVSIYAPDSPIDKEKYVG